MNEEQLLRLLRSVGMECFVKYYDLFSDSSIERADIIEVLVQQEGYEEPASGGRVSNARKIIQAEKSTEAFQLIANSSRVSAVAKEKANELMQQLS